MTVQTLNSKDEIKLSIGLDAEARREIAKALATSLATTYTLYLKTLYYHWNVTGANFISLHEMFGEQYENLHEAGDEIAERIRALGFMTPGTFAEFKEISLIDDDSELPKDSETMIRNLVEGNEIASRNSRAVLEVASKYEDEASVDIMVQRMSYHDKTSWMLRSTISEGVEKI